MSGSGADGRGNGDVLGELETVVGRLLGRVSELQEEADAAADRARNLDDVVRRMGEGDLHPSELVVRLETLEAENADLRERLEKGREGVDSLLAKVRFLEQQG